MNTIRTASKALPALALSLVCFFAAGSSNASAADFGRGTNPSVQNHNSGGSRDGRHDGGSWGNYGGHDKDGDRGNRGGFSFGIGNWGWGGYSGYNGYGYGGGYNRVWTDGYYETVPQRVIVVPERNERRWNGSYWVNVCVPAVYDTRYVRVWHDGCYR